MKKVVAGIVVAVALSLAALASFAGSPKGERPGFVITYNWTKREPATGQVSRGSRTTFYAADTGEWRTVKKLEGGGTFENGFTRSHGGVTLARNESGGLYLEANPRVPKSAPPAVTLDEAALRSHPQFFGTVEVAGQTAYTQRSYADPETKKFPAVDESYLPGVPIPVKVVWYQDGEAYETFEATSVVRRPVTADETMERYNNLPTR